MINAGVAYVDADDAALDGVDSRKSGAHPLALFGYFTAYAGIRIVQAVGDGEAEILARVVNTGCVSGYGLDSYARGKFAVALAAHTVANGEMKRLRHMLHIGRAFAQIGRSHPAVEAVVIFVFPSYPACVRYRTHIGTELFHISPRKLKNYLSRPSLTAQSWNTSMDLMRASLRLWLPLVYQLILTPWSLTRYFALALKSASMALSSRIIC